MEEIGDARDTGTTFVQLGYDFGALALGVVYGTADSDFNDNDDADEIDFVIDANITERMAFELVYANVDFDEDANDDYTYYEGGLSFSF
jgi:hypothetical protein